MNSEIIYGKTIVEVWKERVAASPDVFFLADEKNPQGYTIAQTDELSGRVYAYLKKKGIGREDFVLICVPRGAAVFIAALGVLKSGAAFTIMEDHYPRERIEYIKKDSGSKLEINAGVWEEMMAEKPLDGYEKPGLHDAAFAVYTSGSTGNPKGVLHEYGNINIRFRRIVPSGNGAIENNAQYQRRQRMKDAAYQFHIHFLLHTLTDFRKSFASLYPIYSAQNATMICLNIADSVLPNKLIYHPRFRKMCKLKDDFSE